MTTRPTTLVESDQLAQAAVNIIRNEDFVPKGKRWRFARTSRAHKDYDRAVIEITARRREARENAVEKQIKKERSSVDGLFERAKSEAQAAYNGKISEAQSPYTEAEAQARSARDAAIAAANLAYQQMMDGANAVYQREAVTLEEKRNAAIAEARALHDQAYALLEEKRKADLAQIINDLKTIRLEGPMRIVEDKLAWSPAERKKALIGIVDMAGREDFDTEYTDLCLRNVMGYVFQDRYLKPDAQHHKLMDVNLLEALVELALRNPDKRPTIVKYMHDIVEQNPGHSSPLFIKNLTELYIAASADTTTTYDQDVVENEKLVETMRSHIADTLKLTPRRNQVPAPEPSSVNVSQRVVADPGDDKKTPVMARTLDAEITADVDIGDLFPVETAEESDADAEVVAPAASDSESASDAQPAAEAPAPAPGPSSRRRRRLVPEGST